VLGVICDLHHLCLFSITPEPLNCLLSACYYYTMGRQKDHNATRRHFINILMA